MQSFINKPPKFDTIKQSYVLNFNSRVTEASVKNFQLIQSLKGNDNLVPEIIIQFGKASENLYNLDCKYPFSIFQAFGLCISSIDDKLACE